MNLYMIVMYVEEESYGDMKDVDGRKLILFVRTQNLNFRF